MAPSEGAGDLPSMSALLKFVSQYWHHEEVVVEEKPRVGEYYADYSPLTPEEIAKNDPECDELFKHSKPLSR